MATCIKELLQHNFFVPYTVQIGENLQIIKGDSGFIIDEMYLAPTGTLVFRLSIPSGPNELDSILGFVSELRYWTANDIDRIAMAYTYNISGDVQHLTDVMCKEKLLSESDTDYLVGGINTCLREQSFIMMFTDGKILTGAELLSTAC